MCVCVCHTQNPGQEQLVSVDLSKYIPPDERGMLVSGLSMGFKGVSKVGSVTAGVLTGTYVRVCVSVRVHSYVWMSPPVPHIYMCVCVCVCVAFSEGSALCVHTAGFARWL